MQDNKTKHYVGKFISLFKASKGVKTSSLPTDKKYYVFQNNVENKIPRSLRVKDVKLFVGTRGPLGDIGESLLHKRDKGGSSHHEFINKYGRILHLYDEVWWFLLNAGYVKLKVNFLKYDLDDPTFGAVEVSVFLT
jgi:DNA repair protein RAD5